MTSLRYGALGSPATSDAIARTLDDAAQARAVDASPLALTTDHGLRARDVGGRDVFVIVAVDVCGDGAERLLGPRAGLRDSVARLLGAPATHALACFVDDEAVARAMAVELPALRIEMQRAIAARRDELHEIEALLLSDASLLRTAVDRGPTFLARALLADAAAALGFAVDVDLAEGSGVTSLAINFGDEGRPVFVHGRDAVALLARERAPRS